MSPPDWLLNLANTAAGSGFFWAFAFGVVFILIFCKPIAAFIGRAKKLGVGKWAAEAHSLNAGSTPPHPRPIAF